MKGTLFQKPLEFGLFADGETWNQGDVIQGKLTLRNHSTETVALDSLNVALGWADLKKVRAKAPEAFEIIDRAELKAAPIGSQSSAEFEWKFKTALSCPITDSSSSVFLLYGLGLATEKMGQLQISVQPAPIIQEFIKALTIQFRFVLKTQKATNAGVNVKFAPPAAKAFATVEHLIARFDLKEEEELAIEYEFQVKNVNADPGSKNVKKMKKTLDQSVNPKELYDSAGRPRYEKIEALIKEAVDLVESKISY